MEIHFINMVKFRKLKVKDIKNNPLERWLTFFDIGTPREVLEEVIGMDMAISKANDVMDFISQDKEFLRQYQLRATALSDWNSAVNAHREEGKMEGLAIGKIEVAKNSLQEGLSVEAIHRITGLDRETILSLN